MRFFRKRPRQPATNVESEAGLLPEQETSDSLASAPSDHITALKTAAVARDIAAAEALRTTVGRLHPAHAARIDQRVRSHHKGWVPNFDGLDVRGVRALIRAHPDPIAVAVVFSMHRDGHVRKLCVEAMSGAIDPLVVPFLLLRCGDWAGAVRREAISVLGPWVHADHAAVLVRSFPLLQGARFAPTRPAHDISGQIEQVLRSPAARPALLEVVTDQDPITARTAVRVIVEDDPTLDLLKRALATGDVVSIGLVSRLLLTEGPINQQTGQLLWQHPTARLRQEGVYRLLKHGGPDAERIATTAMIDRNHSVRSTAQRWLRDHGVDTADAYRSLSTEDRLGSLLGLGDDPDEKDAAFARKNLDGRPTTRRAALRLLAKLGLHDDQSEFVNAFITGSARERRTSIIWFRRTGMTSEIVNQIWTHELPGNQGRDNKARVVRQLAPMTSVWQQTELALHSLNAQDPMVERAGVELLHHILYRSAGFHSRPDAEHLDQLRSLLETARPTIEAPFLDRLRPPDFLHRLEQLLRV